MSNLITVRINGREVVVEEGSSVAAAVIAAGEYCRTSVSGQRRGPFCGMGICFECRMVIGGRPYTRACQELCRPGLEIFSGE